MALTKAEMAEALFNQLGLNKREARELVDLFFEEVRAALSNGEQVKLSGFGNFDLRDKNQRPGRNPKTGEEKEETIVSGLLHSGSQFRDTQFFALMDQVSALLAALVR